jgi:O-methyltransferase involved in polyketide biosynthesis
MYITKQATMATLQRLAAMAPGSILAMTFMLPFDLIDAAERPGLEGAARGAQASGTPWISFFTPDEIVTLAGEAGFASARHVTTAEIADRYLAGRTDGLRASSGEGILLART